MLMISRLNMQLFSFQINYANLQVNQSRLNKAFPFFFNILKVETQVTKVCDHCLAFCTLLRGEGVGLTIYTLYDLFLSPSITSLSSLENGNQRNCKELSREEKDLSCYVIRLAKKSTKAIYVAQASMISLSFSSTFIKCGPSS